MASKTSVRIGEVFLMRLEAGGIMPLQVVDQLAGRTLSTCALLGRRYADETAAQAAVSSWVSSDVVAEVNIVTAHLDNLDDPITEMLGRFPVLLNKRGVRFRRMVDDAVKWMTGSLLGGLSDCSPWLIHSIGSACLGLKAWDSPADPKFFEQFLTDPAHPLVVRRYTKGATGGDVST